MGNKGGKNKTPNDGKRPNEAIQPIEPLIKDQKPTPQKLPEIVNSGLDDVRIEGYSRDEIISFYDRFMANNPDGKLDKREFVAFYSKIRAEPVERVHEICEFVFKAFDTDKNGYLTFGEFMVKIN